MLHVIKGNLNMIYIFKLSLQITCIRKFITCLLLQPKKHVLFSALQISQTLSQYSETSDEGHKLRTKDRRMVNVSSGV